MGAKGGGKKMGSGQAVRVEAFRRGIPIYRLAAKVGLHPSILSLYLNGHRPLSERLERKLWKALEELTNERGAADGAAK